MTPRAVWLLFALIALCSLAACSVREVPVVPPAPVIMETANCPAPEVPALPQLDAALLLDAPDNVRRLLLRDDLCRQYINGLQATVRCYESQIKEPQ